MARCGVLGDIAALGAYQMNHVWMATLRTAEAKRRLVDAKELQVKGLWCLVVYPSITEGLEPYGKVLEVSREKWNVEGFQGIESTTRCARMTLNEGGTADTMPHQLRIQGGNVLVVIPGRAPLCLRCKRTGHIRRECRAPKYSECFRFGHDGTACVRSYARVASGAGTAETNDHAMDAEEAERTFQGLAPEASTPAKERKSEGSSSLEAARENGGQPEGAPPSGADAMLMTEKIGFPEYISDATELDKEYEVEFKRDTYFENIIKNLKHSALRMAMKLRTGVDRTEWITYPAVVNAFYTRSKNFISFPAGVLQPPLYHRNYPRSVNYGGIGVVIGHEITHGFDDKGRQFDQHGNLKQWWKPEALNLFHAKAQCMVSQYSKYVLPEVNMPVNGVNTQGENIADNGGVKQAFRAYKRREERTGTEPQLPGLNLTHDQLFFLTYAQIWCGTMRPEHAVNTIRTGAHSPGRFRVIGVLSNSEDFAKAYKCRRGSPMNPTHKCVVW
ncbi:neprilysin-like [Ixodes scapularis]